MTSPTTTPTQKPNDPLRMRIFSELNLHLGHHDIDKEMMHETSKHLAFLTRYYLNTPSPDPLSVSVSIIDIPIFGNGNKVRSMAHKIALVVHHYPDPAGPPSTSLETAAATTPTAPGAKNNKASAKANAKKDTGGSESTPRIRVLIETVGTLGHHKCLIGAFSAVAERVIGGLLAGEEEYVGKVEGKKVDGVRPVWDVMPWQDHC